MSISQVFDFMVIRILNVQILVFNDVIYFIVSGCIFFRKSNLMLVNLYKSVVGK